MSAFSTLLVEPFESPLIIIRGPTHLDNASATLILASVCLSIVYLARSDKPSAICNSCFFA